MSIRESAELLYREGVSGFDCSYDCPELDEYAQTLLKPINLYASIRFLESDHGKKGIDAAIASAVRHGVPRIMVIPDNLGDGEPSDAEMSGIAEGLRTMVAMAAEKGVTVTVEDFGNPKNPCSRAKCIKWLLDAVPGLGFAVDNCVENGFSGWYTLEHPVPGDTLGDVRRQISALNGWLRGL